MKMFRLTLIVLITATLAWSCAPDALEGFSGTGDTGMNTNNEGDGGGNNGTGDAGNNGGGGFNAEFLAVAQILTAHCGQAACHGPSANGVFSMPAGVNATPAEVQAALSVTTPTVSGNRLIAPSNPDMSELYVRMTKPAGDPLLMPTIGARPQTELDQIRTWIANGALYQ